MPCLCWLVSTLHPPPVSIPLCPSLYSYSIQLPLSFLHTLWSTIPYLHVPNQFPKSVPLNTSPCTHSLASGFSTILLCVPPAPAHPLASSVHSQYIPSTVSVPIQSINPFVSHIQPLIQPLVPVHYPVSISCPLPVPVHSPVFIPCFVYIPLPASLAPTHSLTSLPESFLQHSIQTLLCALFSFTAITGGRGTRCPM